MYQCIFRKKDTDDINFFILIKTPSSLNPKPCSYSFFRNFDYIIKMFNTALNSLGSVGMGLVRRDQEASCHGQPISVILLWDLSCRPLLSAKSRGKVKSTLELDLQDYKSGNYTASLTGQDQENCHNFKINKLQNNQARRLQSVSSLFSFFVSKKGWRKRWTDLELDTSGRMTRHSTA